MTDKRHELLNELTEAAASNPPLRDLLLRAAHWIRHGTPLGAVFHVGPILLNDDTKQVFVNNVLLRGVWRRKEYALLKLLISRPNHVFSRNELIDQLWGRDFYPETDRIVDCYIRFLRAHLGPAAYHIETARGYGYRFVP